jgi:hypothetical protein
MLSATQCGGNFVKFAVEYFKRFGNLAKFKDVGACFQDWVVEHKLVKSFQTNALLINANLYTACGHKGLSAETVCSIFIIDELLPMATACGGARRVSEDALMPLPKINLNFESPS